MKNISEFGRLMKCRAYFGLVYGIESNGPGREMHFRMKSSWIPNKVDPSLKLFLRNLEERFLSIEERGQNYGNLDREECCALKNLKNYSEIVIKEADKGSAVVLSGVKDYCDEGFKQVTDCSVYELVNSNPVEHVIKN